MNDKLKSCENCEKLTICKIREQFSCALNDNVHFLSPDAYQIYKIIGENCKQYHQFIGSITNEPGNQS